VPCNNILQYYCNWKNIFAIYFNNSKIIGIYFCLLEVFNLTINLTIYTWKHDAEKWSLHLHACLVRWCLVKSQKAQYSECKKRPVVRMKNMPHCQNDKNVERFMHLALAATCHLRPKTRKNRGGHLSQVLLYLLPFIFLTKGYSDYGSNYSFWQRD